MLKLTKRVEYSLITFKHMQEKGLDLLCSAKEISETYKIPYEILAKTLQYLARKDFLKAVQGARGGYLLNVNLADITLIDFVESIEKPQGLVDCQITDECDRFNLCNIQPSIAKLNQNIRRILEDISLHEILSNPTITKD